MIIYAATGNEHKRQELSQLFAPNQIIIPKDKGIDFDPEENGNTFVDNTIIKATMLITKRIYWIILLVSWYLFFKIKNNNKAITDSMNMDITII